MAQDPTVQFNDGAAYERLMGRWSRIVGAEFLAWCALPAGLRWLDVGCGNGAFTEEIIGRAEPASVTGIDPSPAQIAFAKQRAGMASAQFEVGDAQALPFKDGTFDVGVMALVIAFIANPAKAVSELRRVVKPGGTVATYMWDLTMHGVPTAPFYRTLKTMGIEAAHPQSADISAREPLEALWRDAGLKDVELREFRITVRFADFDDFWTSNTLPVGPQAERIRGLSERQLAELKERLQAALPPDANGNISYGAMANAVKGKV